MHVGAAAFRHDDHELEPGSCRRAARTPSNQQYCAESQGCADAAQRSKHTFRSLLHVSSSVAVNLSPDRRSLFLQQILVGGQELELSSNAVWPGPSTSVRVLQLYNNDTENGVHKRK